MPSTLGLGNLIIRLGSNKAVNFLHNLKLINLKFALSVVLAAKQESVSRIIQGNYSFVYNNE